MGRLVITHSSYIKGLIPWLKYLAKEDGIKTVTPAVISRVKGRSESLTMRISISIQGGYKLIARKGNTLQEVFVITDLTKNELEGKIKEYRRFS